GTAGLSVSGSQVLPAVPMQGLEEIRVTLTASGSSEAFDQALLALQEARPLLLVRKLELSPARARRGDDSQTLTVKLDISAVKLL
ncbi:MAG: type II secretion system protein M, partial [Bacteroidales bacterium]|nr:type II secretion system protein M [Bacteroidales bacterium]